MTEPMSSIEAKEIALSLAIRGEVAGMSEDGELLVHLRPLVWQVLKEIGPEYLSGGSDAKSN